jgi:type II secretory pathway component HofQ
VSSTIATASGAPGVDTRSADTTVMTRDGETTVIGGLIYDNTSDTVYKVPVFGDIPLLGWFFKKKVNIRQRVELLIFVTPRIVEA